MNTTQIITDKSDFFYKGYIIDFHDGNKGIITSVEGNTIAFKKYRFYHRFYFEFVYPVFIKIKKRVLIPVEFFVEWIKAVLEK